MPSDPSTSTTSLVSFDPVQVEVWRHLLASIAEEMGAVLQRTAYSPNIKERLDHSCALFDGDGQLIAQAAHIPVHLGAMPLMLRALKDRIAWQPDTMWICNDPRIGGTHLPDITLVAPVFESGLGERLLGFVAARAHHADIGGISPGSMPLSTELFQEGLILPPLCYVAGGQVVEAVRDLICANSRTPDERRGDLAAQVAACETGVRRMQELATRYGRDELAHRTRENVAYAEASVRAALGELRPGTYHARDILDSDGQGATDIPIQVTLTIHPEGAATFDFTGSAPQVRGSLNATEAITFAACAYVVRCLVGEDIPANQGCFAPLTLMAPEGTIVNARFPAAVAGGNVETSQRLVDVLWQALALAAPDLAPASSQGTMNNLTVGGYDPFRDKPFAYYETLAGGAGASPFGDGASAIHSHMTNTRNTPAETLESHYPLRVLEYGIVRGTGGAGKFRGGDGLLRRLELLADAHIALLTERRDHAPPGLNGGADGQPGQNSLTPPDGQTRDLPGKWSGFCPAGTVLTIQTPGGGGWGEPEPASTQTVPEAPVNMALTPNPLSHCVGEGAIREEAE